MDELCHRSAIELAAMIRSREVSSREVVDAHLARIGEVNAKFNAITVVLADNARAASDAADAADRTAATGFPSRSGITGTPTASWRIVAPRPRWIACRAVVSQQTLVM